MPCVIISIPFPCGMKLEGECPLCALRRKLELGEVERYLGASVMEPDTRIQVNEKGFCARHHAMLFAASNRLGHALMLHTHLKETEKRLEKPLERAEKAAKAYTECSLAARLIAKGQAARKELEQAARDMASLGQSCILCDSLQANMDRYVATFFHLYDHDADFRAHLEKSKGFCLPDAAMLMEKAAEFLPAKLVGPFAGLLASLTRDNLSRMEKDIEWFTLKFDYRNQDKPWGDSKDAVERTVNKLRGWCVGAEPNPKEK